MDQLNDKAVSAHALIVAYGVKNALRREGFEVASDNPFPSGNVAGGWIVEGSKDGGLIINIEIVGGPWENDGSWEANE